MKKGAGFLICSIAAISVFAFSLEARASTVGNTAGVNTLRGKGAFSLKETRNIFVETSLDVDVILDRKLIAGDVTNTKLKSSQWSTFKIGYRLFDRIEPYARLGWAHLKAEWIDASSRTKIGLSTKSGFAWGAGIKALIYEFKGPKIKITADGSYRTTDLDPESGYFDNNKTAINKTDSKFIIREWQAALLAAGEIDLAAMLGGAEAIKGYKLSPYGGMTYSEISGRLRLVTHDSGTTYHPDDIKSDKNFGIVVGCDLTGQDYVSFNLEGRFINETAVSGGLAVLF